MPEKLDFEKLDEMCMYIRNEYYHAKQKFPPFTNLHEAFAVIKEELDEFWEVVKMNQNTEGRVKKAVTEARQIAAMALGVMYEFGELYKKL